MDVALQALLGALPSLGIYTGFGWVLILLLRREGSASARHAHDLDRVNRMHDAEVAELHKDIERERSTRRAVEDELRELRKSS